MGPALRRGWRVRRGRARRRDAAADLRLDASLGATLAGRGAPARRGTREDSRFADRRRRRRRGLRLMLTLRSKTYVAGVRGQQILDFLLHGDDAQYRRWWPG